MVLGSANRKSNILMDNKKQLSIVMLMLVVLVVFLRPSYEIYLGPIIALILGYLYFGGCPEIVVAFVLIANDALGTVFLGKISFPYILIFFVLFKVLRDKAISKTNLIYFIVSLVLVGELYIAEFISSRNFIYSLIFLLALMSIDRTEAALNGFFLGVALITVVISLHACITGGVDFYDFSSSSDEYIRKGILGVGIGDPNYSCFLLNIGIVSLWCDNSLNKTIKIVLSVPILYAFSITLSTSGLIALLMTLMLATILKYKGIKFIIAIVIACVVLFVIVRIYASIPVINRPEQIEAYIARMMEKMSYYDAGNINAVTTGRTDIAKSCMDYIFSQSVIPFLFGGNSLNVAVGGAVPHNTYIGMLLQIGVLGSLFLFGYILFKIIQNLYRMKLGESCARSLILKAVALLFATNISLYQGSLWSVWCFVLLVL